jgi:hypothetical protein
MKTDEIVSRLQGRPGYRIADYAEVGLPVFRLSCRIVTQVPKRISSIDEFLLQLVKVGVTRTEEIAAFLGLPMQFVDESLSQLMADELLALVPTNDRTQRLSLSAKGRSTLDGAEVLVPEERAHTIEFDAILQRVVRYGREALLTGRQARDLGYKQIRPLLKRKVGISDLPLRDVQKSLNDGISKRDGRRTVLAVCELYKKSLYFLPAICVVYRAVDGPDIQVSFIVDGKHSSEHDQAFAQADGARLLHIDRDLAKFGTAAESLETIEEEVKQALAESSEANAAPEGTAAAKTRMRPVSDPQSWSFLTAEQQLELKQSGIAYLDAHDHYPLLLNAIRTAQ